VQLWIHLLRGNRLVKSLPVVERALTVGSRTFCDLALPGPGIDPDHGRLERADADSVRFVSCESGKAIVLRPGEHLDLGEFAIAIEARDEGLAGPDMLDRVLALLPALWTRGEPEEAFRVLLEGVRTLFGAEWAAVARVGARPREPEILASVGRRPGSRTDRISRTVIEQVLKSRGPVLVADVQTDPVLSRSRSIAAQVRSIIAAPLMREGKIAAALLLESPVSTRGYAHRERDILMTICKAAERELARATHARELARENERLEELCRRGNVPEASIGNLVGSSPAMRRVCQQIRRVAPTGTTTLIVGESGTGKELVARAIHHLSPRRDRAFVAINCMALPDELIESELFGHARGAFSGAQDDRIGRFEMAHGGTLFLDEVGELSSRVQVKLLRTLQEKVIQRLGEGRDRQVDVRLVAATNANLQTLRSEGRFRADLYFRLSVFVIQTPALRERTEDLPALVSHFVERFSREMKRPVTGIEPAALEQLMAHSWPGNVRELQNVIEAAIVREAGERIGPASLWLPGERAAAGEPEGPDSTGLVDSLEDHERRQLLAALEAARGNVRLAIKKLGISRSALYKKCGRLGIDPARSRH
jgi:transcriptional regulator with GAF, ATPase, and Fis domain